MCGQNVELLMLQTAVHTVTTGLHKTNQPKDSLRTHSDKHRTRLIKNQHTVRNVDGICAQLEV